MVDNWNFNSLVASLAAQCGLNDAPEFEQIIKIPQDQWFLLIMLPTEQRDQSPV